MSKQAFQINNVAVEFNQQPVLQISELGISAGKITAVIGPSGAGKSTMLRVLNLLQTPTQGQVSYFGQPLPYQNGASLGIQQSMAMVFQKPAMFNGDVFYNVALGLKIRRVGREETKERVMQALELVGLKDFAQRSAATLSGGEAQRVALARAIVTRPQVILLDEPTANLDPHSVLVIENLLRQVNKDYSTTVLIVTHNLFQARRLADECVFLYQGQVIEQGVTEQLFNAPQDPRTGSFVAGDMVY